MSNLKRFTVDLSGFAGLPGTNTWYFHENGSTFDDQAAALNAFYTAVLVGSAFHTYNAAWGGTGEIVDSTTGEITGLDTADPWSVTGDQTVDPLPPTSQALLQLRTGTFFGGRELRGRIFLGGYTEASSTDGKPTSALVTTISTAANTLNAAALAVYSPTKHEWSSVSSTTVWSEFAVLRSRRD